MTDLPDPSDKSSPKPVDRLRPEHPEHPEKALPSVTRLLAQARNGDADAGHEAFHLVYDELRSLARAIFSRQRNGTLQPTALVHEAWLKLEGHLGTIDCKRHFLLVAGSAMRQIVCDHARAVRCAKRGGGASRETLDLHHALGRDDAVDLVDLDDCLTELSKIKERHAQVAEMRLFGGLSIDETADALSLSPRTVDSDWAMARAWLRRELAQK